MNWGAVQACVGLLLALLAGGFLKRPDWMRRKRNVSTTDTEPSE